MSSLPAARTPKTTEAETRERLLDAAERLFALRGFRDTAVREITSVAATNIASVNYHFGGKENLYVETMRRRLALLRAGQIEAIRSVLATRCPAPSIEGLVRAFARASFAPVKPDGGGGHLLRLFYREMVERRLPAEVWRQGSEAVEEEFARALRRLDPGIEASGARCCLHSIEGQLTELVQRADFEGTLAQGRVGDLSLDEAVEHVVRFSLAGIRECGTR